MTDSHLRDLRMSFCSLSAPAKKRLGIALLIHGGAIRIQKRWRRQLILERQFDRQRLGMAVASKFRRKVLIGHDRHLSLCNLRWSRFCAICKGTDEAGNGFDFGILSVDGAGTTVLHPAASAPSSSR